MEKKSKDNHTRLSSKQPEEKIATRNFDSGIWLVTFFSVIFLAWYFGWEYQSSWYWYFGVDVNELALPFNFLVEQGLVYMVISSSLLLFIFGVIYFTQLFMVFFGNLLIRKKKVEVRDLFSIQSLYYRNVNFIPIIYFVLTEALLYAFLSNEKDWNWLMATSIPNGIFYQMLSVFLGVILLTRLLGDLLVALPSKWLQRPYLVSKFKIFDATSRFILGFLLIIFTTLVFIRINASSDASVGSRINGNYQSLQRVHIESYSPIPGLELYRQGCDCYPYTYGSFGLIAENNNYLYLTPWKADGKTEFPYPSSLYKIERSSTNAIYIVPYQASP